MLMPHAPPTLPTIIPIGPLSEPNADIAGETNFLTGIILLIITLLSLAHNTQVHEVLPPFFLIFACCLILLVLLLLNKGEEMKIITNESHNRNYLGRFAYRVMIGTGLLLAALFTLFIYPMGWVSILTEASLLGLFYWTIKSPNREAAFTGTNSLSNYWKRITGKATFSQLDYGPGDTVRFSYVDGLTRDSDKQYNVFLNRVLECRFETAMGHVTWERETLWSAHQRMSPDQLSQGLSFGITNVSKKSITPNYYRLLYWEVIIQEVDGSFLERFLIGVDQKGKKKQLKALRAQAQTVFK